MLLLFDASPSPTPPSPSAIVAAYYRAIGGYARLKNIQTLRLSGDYTEGAFRAHTVMERRRPDLRVVTVGGYCEGFDGTAWEDNTHTNKIARTSGAAATASRHGAEFDESFVDAAAKSNRLSVEGLRTIDGRTAWLLRVTLADGWRKDYFMDAKTGLIDELEVSMQVHAHGNDVASISTFQDYRRVDGVLFSFRQLERNADTHALMNALQWRAIAVNPKVSPTDFHPPCRFNV